MLHDAIGQAKGFDSFSILLLLSLVCAICMWQFPSATVANFLFHPGFRQVKQCSHGLDSFDLTLFKLIFGHVDDGFLSIFSAAATVPNISTTSVRSLCVQFLC